MKSMKLIGLIKGFLYRLKNLPNSIKKIKLVLSKNTLELDCNFSDGRLNSSINEFYILDLLTLEFPDRIKIPKCRMWYDFLFFDFRYGWLPVNIKITTMKTSDNTCNITGLVHSYTSHKLDFDKMYSNGTMSKLLIDKINNKYYNRTLKKDYYFLVINKNTNKIIINSINGLTTLTPNVNNLPFQINWSKNEDFKYRNIKETVEVFFSLYSNKVSWKTSFLQELKKKGQYFTKNKVLKNKIKEFVLNKPLEILEPSVGRGDLVEIFPDKEFVMYEIDSDIKMLDCVNTDKVNFCNFLIAKIDKTFDTIIGNPPFIKTSSGNLYIKFVEKCFDLLKHNGEMIFIIPSIFFKLTSASKILSIMYKSGSFTHVFHPHNESMFENASVDILVFRYCKNDTLPKKTLYNNEILYTIEKNGILTFESEITTKNTINDFFDVKVGIVSGCDKVYKNQIGNVELCVGENKYERFLITTSFPSGNNEIDSYLLLHKELLLKRRINKFNENNWFSWGALRNYTFTKENYGKPCVYIHNLTRNEKVAFVGTVTLFSGNLMLMVPKIDINLSVVVDYLNSENFKKNYTFSGRFKIGHKQLCNVFLSSLSK